MAKRSSKIEVEEGDAVEFIQQVNSILKSWVDRYDVGDVVLVKLKNWFDHKWLNYSGKAIVQFKTTLVDWGREEALEENVTKEITIPPFNPNRVLSSKFIRVKDTGNTKIENAVHEYRRSTETGRNLVKDYTNDGVLLWYSSNTQANRKGSLMVYTSQNGEVATWYASFENLGGWRVTKTKGINAESIQTMADERRSFIATNP